MAGAPVSDNHLPLVRITWAAVVVLGGLAASFVLWDPLEVDERAHVRRLIAQAAESIKADLEADVQTRLLAQVRLAELEGWEEHPGETLSTLEWTLNCRLFLDHYPSFLNLEWLDAEGRLRWRLNRGAEPVNVPAGAADTGSVASIDLTAGVLESGRGPAAHGAPVSVSAAFRLPDGTVVTRVVAPVLRQGVPIGFLSSLWDPRAGVETMLSDHSRLGYVIVVTDGPLEIFRTPGTAAPGADGWTHEVEVRLPGTDWQIRIRPGAALLADLRSPLPELAGVLGGLLGSAVLLSWRFAKTAQSTSRELVRARDELDLRVGQRTAELKRANERLEAQVSERLKAEERLRHLSGRLLRLQDEERRRIARELHDGTTQMLGALAIGVGQAVELARRVPKPEADSPSAGQQGLPRPHHCGHSVVVAPPAPARARRVGSRVRLALVHRRLQQAQRSRGRVGTSTRLGAIVPRSGARALPNHTGGADEHPPPLGKSRGADHPRARRRDRHAEDRGSRVWDSTKRARTRWQGNPQPRHWHRGDARARPAARRKPSDFRQPRRHDDPGGPAGAGTARRNHERRRRVTDVASPAPERPARSPRLRSARVCVDARARDPRRLECDGRLGPLNRKGACHDHTRSVCRSRRCA